MVMDGMSQIIIKQRRESQHLVGSWQLCINLMSTKIYIYILYTIVRQSLISTEFLWFLSI